MGVMTAVGCSEWRGLLALRAIGRSGDADLEGLTDHLEQCDQCRADAEEVDTAAAALALLDNAQVEQLQGDPVGTGQLGSPASEPVVVALATSPQTARPGRRRWVAATAAVAVAAAAVAISLVTLGVSSNPPTRTVALTGQPGVTASVALSSQSWGTRATLKESGQAGGQVLTVSMRTNSGRWWVAGSYRTTGRPGTLQVQLSVRRAPTRSPMCG